MALSLIKCLHRAATIRSACSISRLVQTSPYSTSTSQIKYNKFEFNPHFLQLSARSNLDLNIGNCKVPLPAIDMPTIKDIIDTPLQKSPLLDVIDSVKGPVELPNTHIIDDSGIQAARLIVIRRRKMKKHKLRKLRKKMKFDWAKVRQRRELRKEKAFQAVLIGQIKEAEKFSAEQYVSQKIQKATETPIPRFWKGKRLPQFIIKQKLGIK